MRLRASSTGPNSLERPGIPSPLALKKRSMASLCVASIGASAPADMCTMPLIPMKRSGGMSGFTSQSVAMLPAYFSGL
jgi:hypothetical protein